MLWDESVDARAAAWAADAARGDVDAWRALLVAVAPEVERWAIRHPTLRRWRLNSPDDARAVLVAVIERLAARDYAALRAYNTRRAASTPVAAHPAPAFPGPDDAGFDQLIRVDEAADDEGPNGVADATPEPAPKTPFRAWLRTIARYALYDHVRRRLGWTEHGDRRALGTDATRMDDAPEPGARPPMTDWLTVRAQVEAVDGALRRLPDDMQAAVRAWSEGAAPAEIAAACGAESPDAARRLVRAAHARLRAALRDG